MGRTWWARARLLGGAAILLALVRTLGAGPFLDGVRTVDGWSLAAATGIAAVTTVCCAWRWRLVAGGLGVAMPLGPAIAAYYRSQFLNTVLPGGVLGDLHRGVVHGRDAGDVSRGLRAVGWERLAGQLVQAALAVVVLLTLPSPVRSAMPAGTPAAGLVALVLAAGAVAIGVRFRSRPRSRSRRLMPSPAGTSRWARAVRAAGADLRHGVLARRAWPGIVAASVVVVAGHAATFLVAARATGVPAPPATLLPLALLILLAMAVPANIGGWGPREGMAAWTFAAAGLGAAQGVATAVAYGVLALAANLPGALVLLAARLAPAGAARSRAGARRERAAHG
ncbi:MAG: hypothetical protein QOE53_2610 [Pseudonocardiales bacterium]|nr:hypothetical protein [Pseudonocardiales bacterium]